MTGRSRSAFRPALLALLFLVLSLSLGAAAQEGEGGHEAASGSSGMLGKVINFVLLFGALVYFLARPLKNFLSQRTSDIRSALDEARSAREQAERKLVETQARLAALEGEAARMKSEAEADGLRARDGIHAQAEKEAERIRSFAAQEIDLRVKAGVQELKERTVELASDLAAGRLTRTIGPADHAGLIDRSLDQIEEFHEKSEPR
jgi:F-type H+-transporting ATPase subunit b